MPKMDVESLIEQIKGKLVAGLDAKLTEITTEKGDSLTLKPVKEAAYYGSMNEATVNFDPFVIIAEADVANIESNGPAVRRSHLIEVGLVLDDSGQDPKIMKRMYRYRRAIEEVLQTAWDKIPNGVRLSVMSLPPVSLKLAGRKTPSKITGVDVEATLG